MLVAIIAQRNSSRFGEQIDTSFQLPNKFELRMYLYVVGIAYGAGWLLTSRVKIKNKKSTSAALFFHAKR